MNWRTVSVPLLCLLYGCGTADLGPAPEFIWWTDHESGNLSDWNADAGGYTWTAENGTLQVVTSPTRSGRYAMAATVVTPDNDKISSALASRRGLLPTEAYYSAWFYIPESITDTTYWLCFKFRSRSEASSSASAVDLWDVNLMPGSSTGMRVRLYRHDSGDEPPVASPDIPVARWFQLEAFLRAKSDTSGRLSVWVDGTLTFDVSGQPTVPSSFVEWSVGGVTERITPASSTIFVDDAAITTRRLGPDFPEFWRK